MTARTVLLDIYTFLFSRTYFVKCNRLLFDASLRGLGVLNYKNDVVSGERDFLETHLSPCHNPTVVDVGANEGLYSRDVWAVNRDAHVFAFEPHPKTFARLSSHASQAGKMTAVNAACGSAAGQLVLYDYAGSSGTEHASLHAGVIEEIHKGESSRYVVEVIDLDSFAKEHGIALIHLLKIDAEGHELEVLKGAANLLRENRIRAIQLEFNEMNVVSRVFFKDFHDLLPNYGLFRMLRDGLVALDPYSALRCELFAFQNIVALPLLETRGNVSQEETAPH
jgi:FkbM family methyltransferase